MYRQRREPLTERMKTIAQGRNKRERPMRSRLVIENSYKKHIKLEEIKETTQDRKDN